jgi:hypothetical protein
MPSRKGSPMSNEEEDSSVGGRDGGDLPPPLPHLTSPLRRQIFFFFFFFCRDSKPLRMRDAFVSHFSAMQYTKCRKLHSEVRC